MEWTGMLNATNYLWHKLIHTIDRSTYDPNMTDKMLELTDPDAYFNDIPVTFGPVLFDVMNAMYDKVGQMQFMVGLSMRDPSKDQNVLDLATAAEKRLGSRLDSLLLGNVCACVVKWDWSRSYIGFSRKQTSMQDMGSAISIIYPHT